MRSLVVPSRGREIAGEISLNVGLTSPAQTGHQRALLTLRRLLIIAVIFAGTVAFRALPRPSPGKPELAVAAPLSLLSEGELARIQEDIRKLQLAFFEADCEAVICLAHPRWIMAIGGRDEACRQIKAQAQTWSDRPIEFSEIVFEEQPTLLRNARHEFVVVPSICVFNGGDKHLKVVTFDLAIRAVGAAEWRYVGGSEIVAKQAAVLFPGFPGDFHLPPTGFAGG